MVGRRKSKNNPPNNSIDPVEHIAELIRGLSGTDRDRLEQLPADELAGYRFVPKDVLESMLGGIAYLFNQAMAIGRKLARTHQLKRQPSRITQERLQKISRWRAEKPTPVSWTVIGKRLAMRPDGARKLWRDAPKRGWIREGEVQPVAPGETGCTGL
jgi:hypothetical protein